MHCQRKISEVFSNYIKENIKDIFTFNNFNFDFEIVLEYDKFLATIIKDSLGLDLILLPSLHGYIFFKKDKPPLIWAF